MQDHYEYTMDRRTQSNNLSTTIFSLSRLYIPSCMCTLPVSYWLGKGGHEDRFSLIHICCVLKCSPCRHSRCSIIVCMLITSLVVELPSGIDFGRLVCGKILPDTTTNRTVSWRSCLSKFLYFFKESQTCAPKEVLNAEKSLSPGKISRTENSQPWHTRETGSQRLVWL